MKTKTEAKHTPGDWELNGRAIESEDKNAPHPNTTLICYLEDEHTAEWEANGRFIVRACNSHEELLEACKAAIQELRECDGSQCEGSCAMCLTKAAILKAEVK